MANLADALTVSAKQYKRKPSDFYPTPVEATVALIERLPFPPGTLLAEPMCGEGDIVWVLAAAGYPCIATDLNDTGFGGAGVDFLDPANDWRWQKCAGMVTNPAFDIADKVIRRATALFPYVALLLKSNYWNARGRLKLWDECTPTGHHPLTWRPAFLREERGNSPLMDCDWWIWERGIEKLAARPFPKPKAADIPPDPGKPLLVHLKRAQAARVRLSEALRGL